MLTDKQCDVVNAMAFGKMRVYLAAKIMRCNRETVRYHIKKIKEDTGLDANDFFDLTQLVRMTEVEE